MGKNRKRKNNRANINAGGGGDAGGPGTTTTWDGADHMLRQEHQASKRARKRQKQQQLQEQAEAAAAVTVSTVELKQERKAERRHKLTAKLTHDSQEKREASKLRLNITKTQREMERLRPRLEKWDDVEEQEHLEKERQQQEAAAQAATKKRGRLGPESWKLKGAARPAWQVCEFDVRYECPHQKAHEKAREKARRIRNLVVLYKGKFGRCFNKEDLSYPHRRQFLALLMQFGLLNMQAKKYKTARLALLECLDLDGTEQPITDARCFLMRLYLQVNRPQSVYQLWNTRLSNSANKETSVWVLYSVALVEYVRWKDFGEGSRREAEAALVRAFQGNVLCAYYLAFCEFFHQHMEYTDEIEQGENPLEQAIEYCSSEQMGMWMGTDGAVEWVQETLLRGLHGQSIAKGSLSLEDLEWSPKLLAIEEEYKAQQQQRQAEEEEEEQQRQQEEQEEEAEKSENGEKDDNREKDDNSSDDSDPSGSEDDDDDDDDDEDSEQVDTLMYAGMFRTTMEMLYESGALSRAPPTIVEEEEDSKQMAEVSVESEEDEKSVPDDE